MKIGLVIIAVAAAASGCTGTNAGKNVRSFSEAPSPMRSGAYNVTNDLIATNASKNAEIQDVIKPGDTLVITFTNLPSGSIVPTFNQRVGQDGCITLIYNNVFHAAGKKTGDLENEIREFFVPALTNLAVTVRISCDCNYIYVDGEFRNPGGYSWTNGMTLKDAIEAAGGFTEYANRRIRLIHVDGTIEKFILRGDWPRSHNPALRPCDKIHNPRTLI